MQTKTEIINKQSKQSRRFCISNESRALRSPLRSCLLRVRRENTRHYFSGRSNESKKKTEERRGKRGIRGSSGTTIDTSTNTIHDK